MSRHGKKWLVHRASTPAFEMRLGENAPRPAFYEMALAISIPRAEQLEIGLPFCNVLTSGMNTLTDIARSAAHVDGWIVLRMASGAEIRFPVAENPRLAAGTPRQLNRIEISPFGLHWPDLDEDLSFHGLLEGNHGQFQRLAKV